MNEDNFDLIIIGAGIIGAFASFFARKRHPEWTLGLIDKSEVGSGATFYSAALDIPYGHTPLRYKLSKRSRSLYAELRNEFPALPIKDLNLYGITDQKNVQKIRSRLTQQGAKSSPEKIPSILDAYPFLRFPVQTTVITGFNATQALNNTVPHLLAEDYCKENNLLSVARNTKVTSVVFRQGIYELQTEGGQCFRAKRVIQSTGPWINEFLAPGLISNQHVRIKKIVAFHIYKQPNKNDPVFYFFDDDAFLMPKYEDNYWLFSFKCDHWDVVPEINTLSIDKNDAEKARLILTKYAPQFAGLCTEGRVFCDAYTQDDDPVIEEVKGHPNYVIAGAAAGSGYRLAPAIAEEALNIFENDKKV